MNKMRHIATSHTGTVFLTAEFEKKVYSWSLNSFGCVSDFETQLSFGGTRLAVSEDGSKCVAADYHRDGVSLYDTVTGSIVWQRKDIKRTQFVAFDLSDEHIYVGFSEGSMLVLDSNNGGDSEKLRAITKVYFDSVSSSASPSSRLLLKGANTLIYNDIRIVSPTFAFLDVEAIENGIVLSAVGSDLLYYDYMEQKIVWHITPTKNEHFIKLAYSKKNETIYAVIYKYNDPRVEPYHLLYGISAFDGVVKFVFPLPYESSEYGFAQDATRIICSSGDILDISSSEPQLIHKINWD